MSPLTRLDSYQGTEEQWQSLLACSAVDTVFITPQWQQVWWDQFGDGAEMLLLCFKDGADEIQGIAPLARRNGTISFIGSQDVCDYGDFPVARKAESRFYSLLLDHLDLEAWQTVDLWSLRESSPTLVHLPEMARARGYTVEIEMEDVAPVLELPEDWDTYLQGLSKKDRHELRRKMRRLYSRSEEPRFQAVSDPADVENSLDDFFRLMRDSREVKHRFLTGPREKFFRNIAGALSRVGVFKLFFLEIGEERVAATMCFDYGRGRLLYNSGFNPEYAYYSVGLILKALCVKDAIEHGLEFFDFLRGPEPYKYDLGGKDKNIYHMVVKRS